MPFRISTFIHIKLFAYSLILAYAIRGFLMNSVIIFLEYIEPLPGDYLIIKFYAGIIVVMVVISVIHELIHGLAYMFYGGRVKYGFKIIYAYTKEVSGVKLKRTEFLIVLLSPLVLISLISMLLGSIGGLIFILNLLGSSGDIYMSTTLTKVSKDDKIVDRDYGYEIVSS